MDTNEANDPGAAQRQQRPRAGTKAARSQLPIVSMTPRSLRSACRTAWGQVSVLHRHTASGTGHRARQRAQTSRSRRRVAVRRHVACRDAAAAAPAPHEPPPWHDGGSAGLMRFTRRATVPKGWRARRAGQRVGQTLLRSAPHKLQYW